MERVNQCSMSIENRGQGQNNHIDHCLMSGSDDESMNPYNGYLQRLAGAPQIQAEILQAQSPCVGESIIDAHIPKLSQLSRMLAIQYRHIAS